MITDRRTSAKAETYGVVRLHHRSDLCWAVISDGSGAILTEGGRLMMRLPHEEALRIAAQATVAAHLMGRFSAPSLSLQ